MKVSFQLVAFKLSFFMYIFNGLMMAFFTKVETCSQQQELIESQAAIDGLCFLSAVSGPRLKLRHVAGRKSSNLTQCKRVVRPKIKKALFVSTLLHAAIRKREAIHCSATGRSSPYWEKVSLVVNKNSTSAMHMRALCVGSTIVPLT